MDLAKKKIKIMLKELRLRTVKHHLQHKLRLVRMLLRQQRIGIEIYLQQRLHKVLLRTLIQMLTGLSDIT